MHSEDFELAHDETSGPQAPDAGGLEAEGHLLDAGNLTAVAQWLAGAAAAGVIGNAAYGVLQAVRKRSGARRLAELREKVYAELEDVQRRKKSLARRDLRARVDQLFADFEREQV